jgi:Uma2 family endonuclease
MARTPEVRSSDPSIILYEAGEPQEVLPVQTSMQQLARWRFTVHDYHRMGEAGILHEDDRVELIEGELVEMTAIGSRHFSCVNRLNRLLVMNVDDEAIVSVQNPVRLNEHTEP